MYFKRRGEEKERERTQDTYLDFKISKTEQMKPSILNALYENKCLPFQ